MYLKQHAKKILTLGLVISAISQAAVVPEKYNVFLKNNTDYNEALVVHNNSDYKVSIRANLYEISSNDSARTEVFSAQDSSLLITPRQFTLDPHSKKDISVKLLKPATDFEKSYQLELVPMTTKKVQQAITFNSKGFPEKTAAVDILISQKINIHALPSNIVPNLSVVKKDYGVEIKNMGNISLYLSNFLECVSNSSCKAISSTRDLRLYPKETVRLSTSKKNALVSFVKTWAIDSGKETSKVFSY
ncbi:MAG: hypothetical protein VX335_02740 [Pseudomonadota bacterium]|nr:hypothetical protein [Pseudomonadota bacterium]